jgi:molybdate transport system ATP-binding protein
LAEALDFDLGLVLPGFHLAAKAAVPLQGITAIRGPSGSGKTTLLRALAGLVPGATGTVRFGARDWTGLPAHDRRIGFVFQEPRLFPHMSVADNVAYGARRRARPGRADEAIAAFGLEPLLARRPTTLSGGEARRVALARALASEPDVLFLDEPLTGLDGTRRAAALALIAATVRTSGLPVLYVTHDAAEIAAVADRVLGLSEGRCTGWDPAPQRLRLRQQGSAVDGWLTLGAADTALRLRWSGPPGHDGLDWLLPLEPGRYAIAAAGTQVAPPAVALEARAEAGTTGMRLRVGGQMLDLPAEARVPAGPAALILGDPQPLPEALSGLGLTAG